MHGGLLEAYRFIRSDWRKNYRYHGGVRAFLRCWRGMQQLRRGTFLHVDQPPADVDCVSFSIVPKMTTLWLQLIEKATAGHNVRFIVGDCAGALASPQVNGAATTIIPMLNYHHGLKLDLFLANVCQAPYVLVCDDDIFWENDIPLSWALDQLARDPEVAVASILPKSHQTSVMKGKVDEPMGSCFLLRRDLWLRENLSFQVVRPPLSENHQWIYDTGEFAQVELLRRGYKIVYSPQDVRQHLIAFEGISSWTSHIQKHKGNTQSKIERIPVNRTKAMYTVQVVRSLARLLSAYYPSATDPHLIPPPLLDRAEKICRMFLKEDEVRDIKSEVTHKIARIERAINSNREINQSHS